MTTTDLNDHPDDSTPDRDVAGTGPVLHQEDIEAVERAARAGYKGAAWDQLIHDLTGYVWAPMHALVYSGRIDSVTTGTPHGVLRTDLRALLRDSTEHRDELIARAVLTAPDMLRRHLEAGRWKPELGKSIRSFYLGTVAAAFWKAYRSWETQIDQERRRIRPDELLADEIRATGAPDPADAVERREAPRHILRAATPVQLEICARLLQGATQVEAAADLRLTNGAVSVRMRQLRSRARELVASGVIDHAVMPSGRKSNASGGA
ncbi:hypothetical protein [Cellulomonas cellasea]|uniref:Uncharacterized protein n=1 Tax=Cellulomonas cellasea TaxID=43670 RepID=A0A7W4UJZ1_9CELL|nr:hypothetical protein [Cellulomonas cellasea]MBB2925546.1 hypothetical protein [Cellulomonas cellasea]